MARLRLAAVLFALVLLAGCQGDHASPMLGTLEWDRIDLIAEAAEPVLTIAVREGDPVRRDQVLMTLDDRRARADHAAAAAEVARLEAVLTQQRNGARVEAVAEARERVRGAQAIATNASREFTRVGELRQRKLVAQADLDRAAAANDTARADVRAANAALEQLTNGTRVEEIAQTEAALQAAQARRDLAGLTLDRLTVRAPQDARVDAIAVEPGDMVARGAPLVSLLAGAAPYARVYVPENQRAALRRDARFSVAVQGIAEPFTATLRFVQSEPSFTPYYALIGDDANRLTYIAELVLQGNAAQDLPAGLPVQATVDAAAPAPAPTP